MQTEAGLRATCVQRGEKVFKDKNHEYTKQISVILQ
jgi:hypothetical protein